MRAFRSVTGRSPQPAKKTLKEVEEELESHGGGFGPDDDPARRDSRASGTSAVTTTDGGGGGGGEDKPPWETEEGTRGGRYSLGRPPFEQIDRHHYVAFIPEACRLLYLTEHAKGRRGKAV